MSQRQNVPPNQMYPPMYNNNNWVYAPQYGGMNTYMQHPMYNPAQVPNQLPNQMYGGPMGYAQYPAVAPQPVIPQPVVSQSTNNRVPPTQLRDASASTSADSTRKRRRNDAEEALQQQNPQHSNPQTRGHYTTYDQQQGRGLPWSGQQMPMYGGSNIAPQWLSQQHQFFTPAQGYTSIRLDQQMPYSAHPAPRPTNTRTKRPRAAQSAGRKKTRKSTRSEASDKASEELIQGPHRYWKSENDEKPPAKSRKVEKNQKDIKGKKKVSDVEDDETFEHPYLTSRAPKSPPQQKSATPANDLALQGQQFAVYNGPNVGNGAAPQGYVMPHAPAQIQSGAFYPQQGFVTGHMGQPVAYMGQPGQLAQMPIVLPSSNPGIGGYYINGTPVRPGAQESSWGSFNSQGQDPPGFNRELAIQHMSEYEAIPSQTQSLTGLEQENQLDPNDKYAELRATLRARLPHLLSMDLDDRETRVRVVAELNSLPRQDGSQFRLEGEYVSAHLGPFGVHFSVHGQDEPRPRRAPGMPNIYMIVDDPESPPQDVAAEEPAMDPTGSLEEYEQSLRAHSGSSSRTEEYFPAPRPGHRELAAVPPAAPQVPDVAVPNTSAEPNLDTIEQQIQRFIGTNNATVVVHENQNATTNKLPTGFLVGHANTIDDFSQLEAEFINFEADSAEEDMGATNPANTAMNEVPQPVMQGTVNPADIMNDTTLRHPEQDANNVSQIDTTGNMFEHVDLSEIFEYWNNHPELLSPQDTSEQPNTGTNMHNQLPNMTGFENVSWVLENSQPLQSPQPGPEAEQEPEVEECDPDEGFVPLPKPDPTVSDREARTYQYEYY